MRRSLFRVVDLVGFVLAPAFALLLLGGCATPPVETPVVNGDGKATLTSHAAGPVENFTGTEIPCQIQSIDGNSVEAGNQLRPGRHSLIVILGGPGAEFVGEVHLLVPAARSYRLKAERKDDDVTLSLVDEEAAKTVATSTEPFSSHIKFLVFVVQK